MENRIEIPPVEDLEKELQRVKAAKRRNGRIGGALCVLATLVAAAVLAVTLWLPIVRVYGSAMEPALHRGDCLVAMAGREYQCGDVIAFYHNNTIQVRRIAAGPGSWVQIDENGVITVDGVTLEELYPGQNAPGQCDLTMPYQVPDGCYFVLGDNRAESIDSRSSVMGCVSEDRIIGRILFRVWPLDSLGTISGN